MQFEEFSYKSKVWVIDDVILIIYHYSMAFMGDI